MYSEAAFPRAAGEHRPALVAWPAGPRWCDPDRPAAAAAARPVADRLPALDGLRGLAALYVVHHHVLQAVGWRDGRSGLPAPARLLVGLFTHGHLAVGLFIVLSGYCLMLPVLRSPTAELPRGYLGRRARRLLPAYYAALLASLALAWAAPASHPLGRDNLAVGQVASHLVLAHNWSPATAYAVNGPLWSVATEAQIYLLFPLVLLPAWRRWGAGGAVTAGFAAGAAAFALAPATLWRACPWYLGLFAIGMAAAEVTHGRDRPAERRPWGLWGAGLWAVAWAVSALRPRWGWYAGAGGPGWGAVAIDAAVGVGTACLIIWLASDTGWARPVGRALRAPWAATAGRLSYGLYLTHMPVVLLVAEAARRAGWGFRLEYVVTAVIAIPLALTIAAGWWRAFESPFLRARHASAPPAPAATDRTAGHTDEPMALPTALPASLARAA